MKLFRKLTALLLLILFVLSSFAMPAVADETPEDENDDDTLPAYATLVGSPDLPPIGDQGEVGCCASMAITYMQFTNAVSRYLRANDPEHAIEPASGEMSSIYSPKWTYLFAGSGTAWVYNILVEQGCPTFADAPFVIHPLYKRIMFHQWRRPTKVDPMSIRWDIDKHQMEEAMRMRLGSYEQIWMNNEYKTDGKLLLTQTEKGQALLEKIKRSILDGNVVVTGGFSSAWTYRVGLSSIGNLAKKRTENALVCSLGSMTGGHQLSIVGYDDDIECIYKGVTLKGAFLVANSWGTSWMNDGYVWLMYDALNEVSEYEELNAENRVMSMDQFCFTDWRTDIVTDAPELYVEADVSARNRDDVTLQLLRKDLSSGVSRTQSFYLYNYVSHRPNFGLLDNGGYFNFAGELSGEIATVTFAHSYQDLLKPEQGKSLSDYQFGVGVLSRGKDVTLHALRLKNAEGKVIASADVPEEGLPISGSKYIYFDAPVYRVSVALAEGEEGGAVETPGGLYAGGTELTVRVKALDGYSLEDAVMTTESGELLPRNEAGDFVYTVSQNTVLTLSGVKVLQDEPTPTPSAEDPSSAGLAETSQATAPESGEGDPSDSGTQAKTGKTNAGLIIGLALLCAAVAAGAAAILVSVRKKSKKN